MITFLFVKIVYMCVCVCVCVCEHSDASLSVIRSLKPYDPVILNAPEMPILLMEVVLSVSH